MTDEVLGGGAGGRIRRGLSKTEMWRKTGHLGWVGLEGPRRPTLELTGTLSHRSGELARQWGDAGIRERWEGQAAAWEKGAE